MSVPAFVYGSHTKVWSRADVPRLPGSHLRHKWCPAGARSSLLVAGPFPNDQFSFETSATLTKTSCGRSPRNAGVASLLVLDRAITLFSVLFDASVPS
jgi:hypothetical protein